MGPALVDHVDDLATTFDTVNANALPSQRHRERETDIAQADNHHRGRLLCRHSRYSILLYTMRVAEASSAADRIRQRPFVPRFDSSDQRHRISQNIAVVRARSEEHTFEVQSLLRNSEPAF